MLHKAELLLPAGSLVKLKTAILYGADAVYAGTPDMSLRTQSKISLEDLQEGIKFVHDHGKKIYLILTGQGTYEDYKEEITSTINYFKSSRTRNKV